MRSRLVLAGFLTVLGLAGSVPREVFARQPSLSLALIDRRVGTVYGDPKPRLVHAEKTWTESSHDVMYVVELSGTFRRGRVRARYLYFSALRDRWYVWGIRAYSASHHLQWLDASLRNSRAA